MERAYRAALVCDYHVFDRRRPYLGYGPKRETYRMAQGEKSNAAVSLLALAEQFNHRCCCNLANYRLVEESVWLKEFLKHGFRANAAAALRSSRRCCSGNPPVLKAHLSSNALQLGRNVRQAKQDAFFHAFLLFSPPTCLGTEVGGFVSRL